LDKVTDAWKLYQAGLDYHTRISHVENVDKAERFYAGDQWKGVVANGLPTPVFNIHKRVINYFISAILSQDVKMQFSADNVPEGSEDPQDQIKQLAADIVNDQCAILWERLKMTSNLRHVLRDGAISGDMAGWSFWNESLRNFDPVSGVEPEGDIDFELLDSVNVFFGNPNDYRVQRQPYIIISFRALVSELREEAKQNGVSKQDILNIVADKDYTEQSGDRAKVELESGAGEESGKCIALIKLWRDKKTGHIWWNKSTKSVVIRKDQDYGITKYPIAWSCWDFRKNSYHGQSVGLELIPNQIFINKMFAMVMLHLMKTAFPKVVYNSDLLDEWNNQIGQAIPAHGEDMTKVAHYLQPAQMSNQVMNVIEAAIKYTKELVGASDAGLGEVRPDNHAAIIAVQQASMMPLETIKQNLYQWVEDLGQIWFDFMAHKYGVREVIHDGKRIIYDFNQLQTMKMKLKIDVGPSSYWSEITAAQTLDALLGREKIDFIQYLERMPDGYIPKKQELLDELKANMEARKQAEAMLAQQDAMMSQDMGGMPPMGQPPPMMGM